MGLMDVDPEWRDAPWIHKFVVALRIVALTLAGGAILAWLSNR
jgi:hypothetical protein